MAFTGRFGSQSMFQGLVSNGKAPVTSSMLNGAIRCMSSSKLFIGGFSSGTGDHSLKEAFTSFGDVAEDILRIMIFPLVAKSHNTDAGGTDLVNYESAFFYVQHEMCVACGVELGVRYLRSNHLGKEVLMDVAVGYLRLSRWVPTEVDPLPPQFFLLERLSMAE